MLFKPGYREKLYILPFDHRASFFENLLGVKDREPNVGDKLKMIEAKEIIYQGFKTVAGKKIPKKYAAILTDEEYGERAIVDAKKNDFIICLPVEKSGQEEFDFRYGLKYGEHIKKFAPKFVKALVRYNPGGDRRANVSQKTRLHNLSDFCHNNDYKFMLELLIPWTPRQKQVSDEDKKNYDEKIRPGLLEQVIWEFQLIGIEPDVWKIEGFNKTEDYKAIIKQLHLGGRENVGVIILGRGEDENQIKKWFTAGRKVSGVIGFAVGRTVFMDPLKEYFNNKISKDEAIKKIGQRYYNFYKLFTK